MRLQELILGIIVILIIGFAGCVDLVVLNVDPKWIRGDLLVDVEIKNNGEQAVNNSFNVTVEAQKRVFDAQNYKYYSETMLRLTQSVSFLAPEEMRRLEFRFPDIATTLYNVHTIRKVVVQIDPDNVIQETTEDNNLRMNCVPQKVPDRICWLQDNCLIDMDDIDITVRTANTKGGGERYAKRLKGISEMFYQDWPYDFGIIGMQEVKENMTACTARPDATVNGAECLARLLAEATGFGANWYYKGNLGIVVSDSWEVLSTANWEIGHDGWSYASLACGGRCPRRLIEVLLRHRTHGWKLRFYNTHLSHENQESERNEQIEKINEIILNRVSTGELLPIIVGDFNFSPDHEASSYSRMITNFSLVNWQAIGCDDGQPSTAGIDQIWIGKKESFPSTVGQYVAIRFTKTQGCEGGIDLKSPYTIGDYTGSLSDHDSPGFGIKVLGVTR